MQQTENDYSYFQYVLGSIVGNYKVVQGISRFKPYLKALVVFLASVFASFLAMVFYLYVQFKAPLPSGLEIHPELAKAMKSSFSSFFSMQITSILWILGAAIGIWFFFSFLAYAVARIFKGQAKISDMFFFNLFLFSLLPVFIVFGSLLFSGSSALIYLGLILFSLLLVICLRAEYRGIKTLNSLTTARAVVSLFVSLAILSIIFYLVLL